ncbi:cell division control protein 73 [Sarocladium implicatum]|nr:cell division control protein 73 [Sarocladium implicatum]
MATTPDPLLLLRQSITAGKPFVPSISGDASAPADDSTPLSRASHLQFPSNDGTGVALSLDAPTRFNTADDRAVDLRSIYFAWLNRELAIPEYNAAATTLNAELTGGAQVQNLGFIERLDLITWLEGASDDSEYIKPLAGDADSAAVAAASAAAGAAVSGVASKTGAAAAVTQARSGKGTMDPRLQSVYNGERRMGDRNTVLRGIKPTDFSHVRKLAAPFIKKSSSSTVITSQPQAIPSRPSGRRPDPIILLSPSASSILRMSNARSFLEDGKFVPPDVGASSASMLHVQRTVRSVDPTRPLRFILVEGPEQFKPEYWNRVVAVFTTGQTWQFKNYKWSTPDELFKHVPGVFVGWRGDPAPDSVSGWGHRVMQIGVERWRGEGQEASRFRDKEAVEQIWKGIEMNMRNKGWKRDMAPASI